MRTPSPGVAEIGHVASRTLLVIHTPPPVGEVVSIGDLVIDAGLGWFLFAAMGSRAVRRPAADPSARDRAARGRGA